MHKPIIRKATEADIPFIAAVYDDIHDREESGETTTGWLRGIYPVQETAKAAVARDDMFVLENERGEICGTGIINQIQVDVYKDAPWRYPADDSEVMVLHTLVIAGKTSHKGYGRAFLAFYENYAGEQGCPCLRLDTNARNTAARDFYKRHGYEEIGIVPTVFNGIPNVDLVLLEKRLTVN